MSTQTEIDDQALGALMVASKKVDGCLAIYDKEPDNLQNLNTLFNGFTEYISASFNFLMMTGCKPSPEYEDIANKFGKKTRIILGIVWSTAG